MVAGNSVGDDTMYYLVVGTVDFHRIHLGFSINFHENYPTDFLPKKGLDDFANSDCRYWSK